MSDVVEAMARALAGRRHNARLLTEDDTWRAWKINNMVEYARLTGDARAAILAVEASGGLVVGKMPGEAVDWRFHNMWLSGHNAALAAVRANAVEVEGV